ncbi:MAG: P-loop NTPase, partial [Deltaproteobacteria bacterium]|nr:P-loop NTPase [Deltaproteobacteria bacterium]
MAGHKTIWSVGGGKGGVGKSVTTANLGCALARTGKRVMLVDADLGGANLHTYFGIKYPPSGLEDFIKGRADSLEAVAIPTVLPNLRLISGAGEFLGIANPAHSQKQKLIRHIKDIDAEYIIVDLGAGSSYNVLDFFAISNEGIIVLVPEPAAIQNAYIFLKSFVYRRLTRLFAGNPVISAMIKDATDARSAGSVKSFSDLCERISTEDRAVAEAAVSEIKMFRPKLILNMAASK